MTLKRRYLLIIKMLNLNCFHYRIDFIVKIKFLLNHHLLIFFRLIFDSHYHYHSIITFNSLIFYSFSFSFLLTPIFHL
jgi:hypothetical protein